jgi:sec-independent protein translocase protein TatB
MDPGMFGLSFGEIVIIAVLALLLLGPDKLPEAAKTLGKGLRDLRKATDDIKDQVEREINLDDFKKVARPALVPPVPAAPVPGPAGPPPPATSENVPGLEAALAEPPDATPAFPPEPPTAEEVAAAAVPLPTTPVEAKKA